MTDISPSEDNQADTQEEEPQPRSALARLWRPIVLLLVVIGLMVAARAFGLGQRLGELQQWIASLGAWGPLVFILIYIGAVCAAIPGTVLTVLAGALFGEVAGVIYVSIASTLGASLAFVIGRYFARDAVAGWLGKNEKFQRLDRMTARQGPIIVLFMRLVPLFPFNLLNYGFGLTRISFWTHFFWSWIGMLPGTIVYVVAGAAGAEALESGEVPYGTLAVLIGAIVVLVAIVTVARSRLAARTDEDELPEVNEESSDD